MCFFLMTSLCLSHEWSLCPTSLQFTAHLSPTSFLYSDTCTLEGCCCVPGCACVCVWVCVWVCKWEVILCTYDPCMVPLSMCWCLIMSLGLLSYSLWMSTATIKHSKLPESLFVERWRWMFVLPRVFGSLRFANSRPTKQTAAAGPHCTY